MMEGQTRGFLSTAVFVPAPVTLPTVDSVPTPVGRRCAGSRAYLHGATAVYRPTSELQYARSGLVEAGHPV
jgi:hypothetical protein